MRRFDPLDPPDRLLAELESSFGLRLTAAQRGGALRYAGLLAKWNRKINLVGAAPLGDMLRFHFFEAFWVAQHFIPESVRLADVGSGAGFPGLPIKLYRPSIDLTLIERSGKKCVFLSEVCRALGLDARILALPVERFADWSQVDMFTIRALRPSEHLIELVLQHGKALLVLHGASGRAELFDRMQRVLHLRVPTFENRYATLYRKPDVSRETP